jgi:hypothetical protein
MPKIQSVTALKQGGISELKIVCGFSEEVMRYGFVGSSCFTTRKIKDKAKISMLAEERECYARLGYRGEA